MNRMGMFGGDSNREDQHQPRGRRDHSDAVIDPALRAQSPSIPSSDKKRQENDTSLVNHAQSSSDHPSSMPHRVEQFQMSSPRRHHFDTNPSHRLPSPPPPITTMSTSSHSPSPSVVSVDRSSNSTPHIRRSPIQQPYPSAYQHDPIHSARHHSYAPRPDVISHPGAYIYSPQPPFEHARYEYHHPQD
ncbi:hypothetical protein CVT26_003953, partial [Gymnopilus dilepis]